MWRGADSRKGFLVAFAGRGTEVVATEFGAIENA